MLFLISAVFYRRLPASMFFRGTPQLFCINFIFNFLLLFKGKVFKLYIKRSLLCVKKEDPFLSCFCFGALTIPE